MSLRKMLDHKCDIYRMEGKEPVKDGRLTVERPAVHDELPIAKDVPCHFEEVQQQVVPGQPNTLIMQRMRITFDIDADVKLNDHVEWGGTTYKLEKPKNVRGHHIIVMARRSDDL